MINNYNRQTKKGRETMKNLLTVVLLVSIATTSWSQASVVYDPTVASLLVQIHNIQYQLQHWQAELQKEQYLEEQKTNIKLNDIDQKTEEHLNRIGNSANVTTSIDSSVVELVKLDVKTMEDIIEEAKRNPQNIKGVDNDTAKKLQERQLSVDYLNELQVNNSVQRANLINQLNNTLTRLKEAKTDAEVQKINGEINAIQTLIISLENEIKDQDRTIQLVQSRQAEEERKKFIEQEIKERKAYVEYLQKQSQKMEEFEQQSQKEGRRELGDECLDLARKMAQNDKKGDFSGKGLSLGPAKKEKHIVMKISDIFFNEIPSDEKTATVIKTFKEINVTVIDDREETKKRLEEEEKENQ